MWAAALVAAALAPAARAAAPAYRGCVGETRGCRALPAGALTGASALAVTAGRVYVAAYGAGQILSFRRDLAPSACAGCGAAPAYALAGAGGLAAGGGSVFAASGLGRSLTRFSPGLVSRACVADAGAYGCADPARDALAGASAVAVAGRDVYVTSFDGAAVSHFRTDGRLRLADCVADVGAFGCAGTPANVLEGADAVTVRGRDVYVAAFRSGAVVRLTRRANGSLRYRSCVADSGANGCRRATRGRLTGASGLGWQGRRLIVASQSGSVVALSRDLRVLAARGGRALAGAAGVATRGASVYVAAARADAVVRLSGDRLRVRERLRAPALDGVYALAIRGRDLYTVSPRRQALARYRLSKRFAR